MFLNLFGNEVDEMLAREMCRQIKPNDEFVLIAAKKSTVVRRKTLTGFIMTIPRNVYTALHLGQIRP